MNKVSGILLTFPELEQLMKDHGMGTYIEHLSIQTDDYAPVRYLRFDFTDESEVDKAWERLDAIIENVYGFFNASYCVRGAQDVYGNEIFIYTYRTCY